MAYLKINFSEQYFTMSSRKRAVPTIMQVHKTADKGEEAAGLRGKEEGRPARDDEEKEK